MDTTTSLPRNFGLQHSRSPLDALVRKASLQRDQVPKLEIQIPQDEDPDSSEQQVTMTGQQKWTTQTHNPPISPLLHGRFARDSFATNSSKDNNSYLTSSAHPSTEYDDNESIYSESPSYTAPWNSWRSTNMLPHSPTVRVRPDTESSTWIPVPTVIVSSADTDVRSLHAHTGRTATNSLSPSIRPSIPPDDEKRRVLERNMRKTPNRHSDRMMSQQPLPASSPRPDYSLSRGESGALSPGTYAQTMHPPTVLIQSPRPVIVPTALPMSSSNTHAKKSRLDVTDQNTIQNVVNLPGTPSSRPMSPATRECSELSYYSEPVPEHDSPDVIPSSGQQYLHPNPHVPATFIGSKPQQTPHEYLQLGIQCHEANKLRDSAIYFEKSAKEDGGCGIGMLMWGLTLRHGWGCLKDEKKGFNWLRRAAECAVDDLEKARVGKDSNLVQTELVLAIYEVGQCFFQGWGVPKDQKMAVSYYQVAARLGDPDAQNDLAFCLSNGKGCKKDRKEAAKWYRAAVAQGQSDIGLAWIYKEKYQ